MLKKRSTPPGQHRPVLLEDVLRILDPQPGQVAVDCTVGWAGHAAVLLEKIGPSGLLLGFDLDSENLAQARQRLDAVGTSFQLHHGNFAGIETMLAGLSVKADMLLADLGMSSMQVDDPERGFSYVRDGTLDMRMDRTRGPTASQWLQRASFEELVRALEASDEPHALDIAAAIVAGREAGPLERTTQLAEIVSRAVGAMSWRLHPRGGKWNSHPAARTFQAVRIAVNRELANLAQLLRIVPACLRPGGRAAIITFHSGEDRLVKQAFREGFRSGIYRATADEPIRARWQEKVANPRSRSAKLRWARRS